MDFIFVDYCCCCILLLGNESVLHCILYLYAVIFLLLFILLCYYCDICSRNRMQSKFHFPFEKFKLICLKLIPKVNALEDAFATIIPIIILHCISRIASSLMRLFSFFAWQHQFIWKAEITLGRYFVLFCTSDCLLDNRRAN